MLDASGLYRIRYADVLRAMGNYLDAHHFRDITLVETPDGFLIKAVVMQSSAREAQLLPVTYLFANADLETLIEEAHTRRGAGAAADVRQRAGAVRYEDLLRVVGQWIDDERLREIVVMQVPPGTRLKALAREQTTAGVTVRVVDLLLSDEEIREQLDILRGGRKRAAKTSRWPF